MNFSATSIGHAAWQTWSHDQPASVMGITSRGLFIRAADRVIFVSFETQHGPLTITLSQSIDQLHALNGGDMAAFSNHRLIFPTIKSTISASPADVWQAPLSVAAPCPFNQQLYTLKQLASSVTLRRPSAGFGPLLAPLLDLSSSDALPTDQATLLTNLRSLQQALRENDLARTLNKIDQLLGRGSGLTPSGDDCVLGLLLMLNRWPRGIDRAELNRRVIEIAYRRTTTISANLIECSTEGQADERLIIVVDGVVTGTPSIADCVDHVLDWGSSSGIDALAGMMLAITV
jgi:hypothetical protein